MKLLISIGFLLFPIYPAMANIPLFDSSLVKPASPDVLKDIQTVPSTLKKLLDDGQLGEFFKEAGMELEHIRKVSEEDEYPSEEARKNVPWIFYFIANAPLVVIDSVEHARWAFNNRDVDFYLKEEALEMLAISDYRDLFPNDQASKELMASYGAAIMRSFLNVTKSKSYSPEHVFVSDEESEASLKRGMDIMGNAFDDIAQIQKSGKGPETTKKIDDRWKVMNKQLHDNEEQFRDLTAIINSRSGRNHLAKNVIERSEKDFMGLLMDLFPGKMAKVRKYIKMAGYSDQEIRKLIKRTLEEDAES